MEWERTDESKYVCLAAQLPKDGNLVFALESLWHRFVLDIVDLHKDIVWDYIRVEIWEDSGRILVFPGNSQRVSRVDKGGCQLTVEGLFELYNKLINSDVSGDQVMETIQIETERIAQKVVSTFSAVQVLARIRCKEISIRVYASSEELPFCEKTLKS